MISVVLARQLRNGWNGVTPYSPIILAACILARRTHAPGLTFWSGTLGTNPEPDRLYRTGTDPRNLGSVEAIRNLRDVFEYGETRCDFMFYSGMQIDRRGNANNVRVGGGDSGRPLRYGGGQANTSHPVVDDRIFLFSASHTPEIFVDAVDYISIAGFLREPGDRRRHCLPGGGPVLCVTNLGVMDFDESEETMRLKSIHPGVSEAQIKDATGFDLPWSPVGPSVTLAPTSEEIQILRSLDIDGVLRDG